MLFFLLVTSSTEIYTLSLHDALPILAHYEMGIALFETGDWKTAAGHFEIIASKRSEEHTSELQSLTNLVCRLLLEKKKIRHNKRRQQQNTARSQKAHNPK